MSPASFIGDNQGGTPVTVEEHFAQVAAVRASLLLGDNATERHNSYPRRPVPLVVAQGAMLAMVAAADQHRAGEGLRP